MQTSLMIFILITIILIVTGVMIITNLGRKFRNLKIQLKTKEEEIITNRKELTEILESVDKLVEEKVKLVAEQIKESQKKDITLKKALKRSEESNFMKNAFLSNISAEIRTPLNNIIGFASLLEAEISLLENKELFDYAHSISESGDRLLHLLNNIIDISKLEANDMQINLRPCNINNVVANTTQLFVFKANEQKLKLNLTTNEIPFALIDETWLTKVINAILENAIKYTERGFINISTDFSEEKNEILIRIKDTGTGIDPSYIPMIFDPFRQESLGFTKELQGAGLGLPLAKSLVEMMRGRIEIESAKGKGTTVTLFFPNETTALDSKLAQAPSRKQKFKSLQGLEIFIVEDDLMNKIVLYEMTKSLGNVVTAINGDETLRIIEQAFNEKKIFDIMLFDINLPPPWDGIRLMKEVREKWKVYKTIPFVAQTAYAMSGDKERLLEAGFDDYISKPINQQELYSIIKNQLNKI
ncbi:MAG: hybrid sensor histidine kinase/response regulator [Bacteroidales bacterium]|nr:hybrid sensor histidine kinase/response regulator [Bacteroidales bacterium]